MAGRPQLRGGPDCSRYAVSVGRPSSAPLGTTLRTLNIKGSRPNFSILTTSSWLCWCPFNSITSALLYPIAQYLMKIRTTCEVESRRVTKTVVIITSWMNRNECGIQSEIRNEPPVGCLYCIICSRRIWRELTCTQRLRRLKLIKSTRLYFRRWTPQWMP